MIEESIFILKNNTIIITLTNIIVEARRVETTYIEVFFKSFLLDSDIDAATAVLETSQPIAQLAKILHFSPITLLIIYQA
jgi:hypothetical protein